MYSFPMRIHPFQSQRKGDEIRELSNTRDGTSLRDRKSFIFHELGVILVEFTNLDEVDIM